MNTAEFTLRLICIQGDEQKRLEALTEFFILYDVTRKPPSPIIDVNQLTQTEFQQRAQALGGGKLPPGYTLS